MNLDKGLAVLVGAAYPHARGRRAILMGCGPGQQENGGRGLSGRGDSHHGGVILEWLAVTVRAEVALYRLHHFFGFRFALGEHDAQAVPPIELPAATAHIRDAVGVGQQHFARCELGFARAVFDVGVDAKGGRGHTQFLYCAVAPAQQHRWLAGVRVAHGVGFHIQHHVGHGDEQVMGEGLLEEQRIEPPQQGPRLEQQVRLVLRV